MTMKILGFLAALMLAVAAHGQGTANVGGGGGMNFIAPATTLSPSQTSNLVNSVSNVAYATTANTASNITSYGKTLAGWNAAAGANMSSNLGVSANIWNAGGAHIMVGSPTVKLIGYSFTVLLNSTTALSNGWSFGPTIAVSGSAFSTNNANLASGTGSDLNAAVKTYPPMSVTNLPTIAAGGNFYSNVVFNPPIQAPPDCNPATLLRAFNIQYGGAIGVVSGVHVNVTSTWRE